MKCKILLLSLMMFSFSCADEKVYIDGETFKVDTEGDEFYIHTGNNVWFVTHSINRDSTGLFAYESSLSRCTHNKMEYERKWKCPYCYIYWPVGKACANADCPSKYK